MPEGEGTYGNKVGRPSNKRTGEDFLDREEKKKKKKNIKTPDNFGFGDMPADYRMRYLQMLEEHNKKNRKKK